MGSAIPTTVSRGLRPLSAIRSIPAILDRLDRLEGALSDASSRIDELQETLGSVDSVRDDVRDLTVRLTEQLNSISASLRDVEER